MGTRLLQSAISLFSTTQMYGGPFVSLRIRHMKVIWAQTTRHARYTRVSSSHAPFFLVPRYYLHAPATQAIPLPSIRQGSHDPCGDEIGTLRTNALTDPHNHWYVYLCTCFLPFMSGTINFLLKLKHTEKILMMWPSSVDLKNNEVNCSDGGRLWLRFRVARMTMLNPVGDVKMVSPISTFVLTWTL